MDALAGTAEVASMLGVSKQRVRQLAAHPGFPEPLARLAMGPVWRTEDVIAWAKGRGREVKEN